ncbi:bifunctional adenosylcobinamide kinase/adenosylcobinamide-phosphate guanylyltransferase [Cyanobium sp. NIES-981]|uniref:bifunctional adenosylcobinamide kinase/adenosylcobinamide-phosphate guanylyltransferase n=1 Tax=Cyanobium sp. NIES-981 TaxID=1851505 RepID=UPI000B35D025|nr:bifunctional adenosylcobinamide kinase/adenosylcobinamide-phosphate guanylyltransferase [Cyanobium sp. NIES-981]
MQPEPRCQLVTGAARSGKSRWAEHLAAAHSGPVLYLATADPRPEDPLWQARLQAHRQRRPAGWRLREVQADLADALRQLQPAELALVDALGTWVAWGLDQSECQWRRHCDELSGALAACPGQVILVSEQTGWGVVPPTAIGGLFRDRLGELEQQLVRQCQRCWLVVAGRALDLAAISQAVPR